MSSVPNPALLIASYPRKLQWQPVATVNSSPVPSSALLTLMADIVPEEQGEDEMVITEHPVEQGSVISDHAFKLPARLELQYGWSLGSDQNTTGDPGYLRGIYSTLLQLQAAATMFTVYTGKRIYQNMLIRALRLTNDRETENILALYISMQQVLMAVTSTLTIAAMAQQALPQQTAPTVPQGPQNLQPASNYNSGSGS